MATGDSPDQPRLSVQGGDPVDEGDAAQFTVSASPAPAAGDSLTFGYTVIQRGDYVADRELGQKHATIGNSGRATITVLTVGNDTDDADGEIFVTLNNGEGYTASSDRSASVEVRDNDNPEVSFADDPATATVSEGDGTYDVVVNLVPAPHAATTIRYQIGGVAEAGEALIGQTAGEAAYEIAANIARDAATPINDMRGTIAHRKHLSFVLTQRALRGAVARARGMEVGHGH